MNKKPYNNAFSDIPVLRIMRIKTRLETCKYDTSLQVLKSEMCSRPAGTQSRRKGYNFRAIRQRKQMQEQKRSLQKLLREQERWDRQYECLHLSICHLITRLTAPREHI